MMTQCFVAFIDLLGFSEMVSRDCNNPNQKFSSLQSLIDVMERVNELIGSDRNIYFSQFSDSIVLSSPFDRATFESFIEICRNLQVLLYQRGVMCRGGIAVGRHFFQNNFIFSEGLIEAYRIESQTARVPRIVLSQNLIDLVAYPNKDYKSDKILLDKDQIKFINYMPIVQAENVIASVNMMKDSLLTQIPASLREKYIWMLSYIRYTRTDTEVPELSFCNVR